MSLPRTWGWGSVPFAEGIIDLSFRRHKQDLEGSWQCRLLRKKLVCNGGVARPRDLIGACILSVVSHNYDEALPVLLRVALPGFTGIGAPFFCSSARIARTGDVMVDMISKDGRRVKNQGIFTSSRKLQSAFRRFADEMALGDRDRVELFEALKRWVVCDYRLDPAMNPADPDARRLVH